METIDPVFLAVLDQLNALVPEAAVDIVDQQVAPVAPEPVAEQTGETQAEETGESEESESSDSESSDSESSSETPRVQPLQTPRVGKGKGLNYPRPTHLAPRKPTKKKPGQVALKEIRRLQRTTDELIPLTVIDRLARTTLKTLSGKDYRITGGARLALRMGAEAHLGDICTAAAFAALHAKRITVMAQDVVAVERIANCGYKPMNVVGEDALAAQRILGLGRNT